MAYVNTGTKRSLTFTVTKKIGGVIQVGYPKEYDGRLAFPSFAALTDVESQQLTTVQYNARLTAFHSYVQSLEPGWDPDNDFLNSSTVYDPASCPPPPTTTTTTTVATTTTTTTAATTTTTAPVTTTTTTSP